MRLIMLLSLWTTAAIADDHSIPLRKKKITVDRETAQIALSATICAGQQYSAAQFRRLRDGISVLSRMPRFSAVISQITRAQEELDRLDLVIREAKEKLIDVHAKSLPCGRRDVKAVARCMTLEPEEFARESMCEEPNVVIYLGVDGVPMVVTNE